MALGTSKSVSEAELKYTMLAGNMAENQILPQPPPTAGSLDLPYQATSRRCLPWSGRTEGLRIRGHQTQPGWRVHDENKRAQCALNAETPALPYVPRTLAAGFFPPGRTLEGFSLGNLTSQEILGAMSCQVTSW